MLKAEAEEKRSGSVTSDVLALRKKAKEAYPDFYAVYMNAKQNKQQKEIMRPIEERMAIKREKKIRRYSILKGRREIPGFGKGPRDL